MHAEVHVEHVPALDVVEQVLAGGGDVVQEPPVDGRRAGGEPPLRARCPQLVADELLLVAGEAVDDVTFGHPLVVPSDGGR